MRYEVGGWSDLEKVAPTRYYGLVKAEEGVLTTRRFDCCSYGAREYWHHSGDSGLSQSHVPCLQAALVAVQSCPLQRKLSASLFDVSRA